MLRVLRDGAKSGFLKYILMSFLVLAAGGLVLTDVGGFFRGGASSNVVAEGKGIKITTAQFDRQVRRILSRQGMGPEEAYNRGFIMQILNNEVQTQILTREARALGLNVSDATVLQKVSEIAAPFAQDGKSKKEALTQVLRSQGISEDEFIESVRQEMGNTLFQSAIVSGAETISKNQASDLYQYQNERRDVRGFTLMNKYAEVAKEPNEENLQKYYEANKSDFLISEKRDITVATLKKEMLADKVEISDDELQKAYDDNIEAYKKPEQRKLQQAILDLETDAIDVVKRVNKGSSLKKSVNRVAGNNSPYLGENDFEQGGLLEEISNPVFAAEEGAVLGPIQTALGWHVLVLKNIMEPSTTSFDKVKSELRDELLQNALEENLVETANMIDDRLASGEDLDVVVAEVGLTTETFTKFNQAGLNTSGKDLFGSYQGDRAQILESAFDFEQGESSPVLELADGRFITVRVDNIEEKSHTPFDEVKSKLETRWLAEQKSLSNKQRADEAMAALQDGQTLEDVAKKFGASIQNFNNLKRAETPTAPITLPALRQIYDAKKAAQLKLQIQDGYLMAEVMDIDLPDANNDQKINEVIEQTKQSLPQETVAQYVNNLSEKYKVRINERVLKQIYGTPTQN